MLQDLTIRDAIPDDVGTLTRIWFDGWQDAHAAILPPELARLRTFESFRERMADAVGSVRVIELSGDIAGFAMLKENELYQFYFAASARGTGAAGKLMDDSLIQLRSVGHEEAWLACGIGNSRAARFYEKSGWHLAETFTSELDTPDGVFLLDVWRYAIKL